MSQSENPQYAFIVVMGVSGTGKTTLATALARKLGLPYIEGDDLHPKSNIEKMSAGVPLTDQDREPWLELIRKTAEEMVVGREVEIGTQDGKMPVVGVVVSCSALKEYYRNILRGRIRPFLSSSSSCRSSERTNPSPVIPPASPPILPTYFVFITGPRSVLEKRMQERPGHFMKASMLDSQLTTLESPEGEEGVVFISLEDDRERQVEKALEGLRSCFQAPPQSHI